VGKGRGWINATVVTKPQAGTISKGRRAAIIRAIFLKISRKAAAALIVAFALALHGLTTCAAAPQCGPSSLHTPLHQEEGCHHRQHDGSRQSHGCVCCEPILCQPRAELTCPHSRSTIERTMSVPLRLTALASDSAVRNAPGASEPPLLHSPRPVFLVHRTLLL